MYYNIQFLKSNIRWCVCLLPASNHSKYSLGGGLGVVLNQWLLDALYDVKKSKNHVMWRPYASVFPCVCGLEPSVGFSKFSTRVLYKKLSSRRIFVNIGSVAVILYWGRKWFYTHTQWRTEGGFGVFNPPPRNSEGPPKSCQNNPICENLKIAECRTPTPQDVRKKRQ